MRKTDTIKAGFQDHRAEIPPSVDAFLRTLARWTVEDMQNMPDVTAENTEAQETIHDRG